MAAKAKIGFSVLIIESYRSAATVSSSPQFWDRALGTIYLGGFFARGRPRPVSSPTDVPVNQRPYLDTPVDWGSFITTAPQSIEPSTEVLAWSTKCFPLKRQVMGAKIANRAIVTIQIIGWVAIIIVMAMFLTAIGTSITECLANP